MIKARGVEPVKVTEESIARVPRMESGVLPERHWDTLQQKHRALLAFIRDDEPGTEAIAYYTLDMRELARYKGEQGAGYVSSTRYGVPHIAMHTHPDGKIFTLDDIRPFIQNENTMFMSAVGNDGSLYTLEKIKKFIASEVVHCYIDALKTIPDPRAGMDEHLQFLEQFYTSIQKYGFKFRKG